MVIAHRNVIVVLGLLFVPGSLLSQTVASGTETQSRTQAIVASFSKFKNVSKERRGPQEWPCLALERLGVRSKWWEIRSTGFSTTRHVRSSAVPSIADSMA